MVSKQRVAGKGEGVGDCGQCRILRNILILRGQMSIFCLPLQIHVFVYPPKGDHSPESLDHIPAWICDGIQNLGLFV